MLEPHLKRTPAASTPVRHQEADWSPTFAEACGLERAQLKDARCNEDAAPHQCPLNLQHMRQDICTLEVPLQSCCYQAEQDPSEKILLICTES